MEETAVVVDNAVQAVPQAAQQGSTLGLVVDCIVIIGIIYFLMVRPNKKRMAEYNKMLESIKVGSRVMAAGIYGTVKTVNDKTIEVEIAKGVVVEMNKNAVASVE